ncbi:MAG: hypothetical protein KC589_08160 [Nanoarchaeota archaeon]|nr:hypothetical protein [Nanoarchaeota archaeon]
MKFNLEKKEIIEFYYSPHKYLNLFQFIQELPIKYKQTLDEHFFNNELIFGFRINHLFKDISSIKNFKKIISFIKNLEKELEKDDFISLYSYNNSTGNKVISNYLVNSIKIIQPCFFKEEHDINKLTIGSKEFSTFIIDNGGKLE